MGEGQKGKLPRAKSETRRGGGAFLISNSIRQPDRAYTRTRDRNETISRLSTPQPPMHGMRMQSAPFSADASQLNVAHDGKSWRMQVAPLHLVICVGLSKI